MDPEPNTGKVAPAPKVEAGAGVFGSDALAPKEVAAEPKVVAVEPKVCTPAVVGLVASLSTAGAGAKEVSPGGVAPKEKPPKVAAGEPNIEDVPNVETDAAAVVVVRPDF